MIGCPSHQKINDFKTNGIFHKVWHILRKTNERYYISFDLITFVKIIFRQSNFVSNRTTTMQFSIIWNEVYRSLDTIQYHTKCTNPLYTKFTSNKFGTYNFCCNLYLVIAYVLILTTDMYSHPFVSHCLLLWDNFFNKNAQIWHTLANRSIVKSEWSNV